MTNSIYALIGRNIRHRRLELDKTSQEVADTLQISRGDYLAMEKGTKHIAAQFLFDLTKILGVNAKYFFDNRDMEVPQKGSAMAKMYEILDSIRG